MKITNILKEKQIAILIYILLLSFFSFYFLKSKNLSHLGFEILIFILLLVIGIISILYYGKNKKNIHKVAFLIIILFGIVSAFISPICDISDEPEHITRVEIVSEGKISTDYTLIPGTNSYGYKIIDSVKDLIDNLNVNAFNSPVVDEKINYTDNYFNSAFGQNPFYAYLIPAIGMFLVKLLDLNVIWLLWIPRIANLLLYSIVVSFAIKKSPILKIPLLIVSIIPVAIYQAASLSADCFFNGFAILSIAYFLVLYKSNKIKWVDLAIFYISIILCGLIKYPYLALSLLIFIVPNNNFANKTQNIISKIGILITLLIGLLWSNFSTTELLKSWRYDDFIKRHVNMTEQLDFLKSNPKIVIHNFIKNIAELPTVIDRLFYFSNSKRQYNSSLLAVLYAIFIGFISLFYPLKEQMSKLNKIKLILIGLIIYTGIFFVIYLSWAPVASPKVTAGVCGRYFIPLIIFLPLILNLNIKSKINKELLTYICISVSISFIAGMLMLTVGVKY